MNDDVYQAVSQLLATVPSRDERGAWVEQLGRAAFDQLDRNEWIRVGIDESAGGTGGDLGDAAAVVAACAASTHLVPVAEMVIAARLAGVFGLELPGPGSCVVALPLLATTDGAGELHLQAARVPWARWATHFVAITSVDDEARIHLVDAAGAAVSPGTNLGDEPRDTVLITAVRPEASAHTGRSVSTVLRQLRLAGALMRSVQLASGITAVLYLASRYCTERHQFGRPLRAFQAVQQELAGLAGEEAAANAAVSHALSLTDYVNGDLAVLPIAAAKVRTSMAAGSAARTAHQLHGAIGITREYALQRFTRSLWSWRDEYGDESYWSRMLCEAAVNEAPMAVWERLAPLLPFTGSEPVT